MSKLIAGTGWWPSRAWAGMAIVLVGSALALAVVGGCGDGGRDGVGPASPSASASVTPGIVQAAPVEHVKVGDISIGYRTIGPLAEEAGQAGDPLVMVMGFSGTMDIWSPALVERLAQHRRVIVFDNRGMGETDNPRGPYAFEQLADDTAGLVKALGYGRVVVLGWSMGGNVVLDLTVRYPDLVSGLVSYAGDPGGPRAVQPSARVMKALVDTSGTPEERGRHLLSLLFPDAYKTAHPDFWKAFPVPEEQASAQAIGLQARAMGTWGGCFDGLRSVSCPTLIVTGTEDILTPPQNATLLADRVPASWLARFEGAGHGLMYQSPDELAETVLVFLSATATTEDAAD